MKNYGKKTIDSRLTAFAMIFLLFLLLYLPFSFLKNQISRVYHKENEVFSANLQDRLLKEASDFRDSLKPNVLLHKAFADFERQFFQGNLPVFAQSSLSASRQQISPEAFCHEISNYLKNRHKLDLLFVAASDAKFSKIAMKHSSALQMQGFSSQLLAAAFLKNAKKGITIKPQGENAQTLSYLNSDENLEELLKKVLSTYFYQSFHSGSIVWVLSDHYDFRNIGFYHKELKSGGESLGYFSAAFFEDDLKPDSLVRFAVSQSNPEFSRSIIRSPGRSEGFFAENGRFGYIDQISTETAAYLRVMALRKKSDRMLELDDRLMVLFRGSRDSDLKSLLQVILFLEKVMGLCGFASCVYAWLFGLNFPIDLRRKFLLMIMAVLLPPAFLVNMFARLTEEKLSSEIVDQAKNNLYRKLQEQEMLLLEILERQSISVLQLKTRLHRDKISALDFSQVASHPILRKRLPGTKEGVLYNRRGEFLFFPVTIGSGIHKVTLLTLNNCIRFLNNLRPLDSSQKVVRDQLKKLQLTDGFISDFYQLLDQGSSLAQEIVNVPDITKATQLARMNFFVLPDSQADPIRPEAIGFVIMPREIDFHLMLNRIIGNPPRRNYQVENNVEFFLQFAKRDSQQVTSIEQNNSDQNWPDLKPVFNRAVETGSSGVNVWQNSQRTEISMWLFNDSLPFLLAGICYVPNSEKKMGAFQFVPVVSLILMLFSLLIISEMMGNIFLKPVKIIEAGAGMIAGTRDLSVRVEVVGNDEFAGMALAFNKMANGLMQRQRLSRFVSNHLVQKIESGKNIKSSAEKVLVSLIFSDIRNFTGITEENEPQAVVTMLNHYFTEMEKAIVDCGGIIDRFIGDAVVAVFYPDKNENVAESACRAAIMMRENLGEFNRLRKDSGLFTIENGIGIATGEVICGSLGKAGSRLEYSVVGRPFRRANDLEQLSVKSETKIMVNEETRLRVGCAFSFRKPFENEDAAELVAIADD